VGIFDSFIKELPDGVTASTDIKERALGYFKFNLFGFPCYVPITKRTKRLLKIKCIKGHWSFENYQVGEDFERMARDMLSMMQIQVRETIGDAIERSISDEILGKVEESLSGPLRKAIEAKFDIKALEFHDKEKLQKNEGELK